MKRTEVEDKAKTYFYSQKNMMKYIPGGVHKTLLDEQFTILSMSESFLSLFGYTEEEVHREFHDHFAEMICPEDLDAVRKELSRQMLLKDTVDLEYRIRKKDGSILWILDKARMVCEQNQKVLYCMLLDISAQRKEREELRLSLERFSVIMDQTADIIFEWNILEDTLNVSQNWYKRFGYEPITDHITERLPQSPNLHQEEVAAFKELMKSTRAGTPYSETEFRIRRQEGEYIDIRIRATAQYNSEGVPVKAVGIISDISKEKTQRKALIEQVKRDSLTGLLNKNAAKQAVNDYLERSGTQQSILLLIDLDDFKQVNDHYGHLCGDALIADTAGVLHRVFRDSDIISRVGGDEFLVFIPGIATDKVKERIGFLRQALSEIRVGDENKLISCSTGVALYPSHAGDFNGLFRCADLALYQVKNRKKGEIAFYSAKMEKGGFRDEDIRSAVNTVIDSEVGSVTELLGQYSFRMLYDSLDIFPAVENLLEIIGRAYDVSRVYIFEDSDDGRTTSNTFEWCNTGIAPQAAGLKKLAYGTDLGDYHGNFDENGVFYCGDVSKLEPVLYERLKTMNVCSLLQCAIMDNGRFKGYVGFDECFMNRLWTKEQIESLSLVSKVLSTFLLKYRLEERIKRLE